MRTILYKMDKTGRTRVWNISIDGNCIDISHGTIDGEHQHERHVIEEGKAGRTIEEQVELIYNSKINRKKNGGYIDDRTKLSKELKNQLGLLRPMLASKVNYDKIDYDDCFVQRKYDGHRCLVTMQDGELTAYSRGGKLITSINHILAEISLCEGETLDGELYIHGLPLQTISSKIRKQGIQAPDLNYIVYDKISDEPFSFRFSDLIMEINNSCNSIFLSETIRVRSKDEIEKLFMEFRKSGYEGAIVRFGKKEYEVGRRSKFLMKVKGFEDEEFKVVKIISSVEGWARLVCVTNEGKEFKVSAPGTHSDKREVLENKENYIGKFVRVEFAGWTIAKKPSQPVATMFRDKENE